MTSKLHQSMRGMVRSKEIRAEASCVKHADLIAWLRGTEKDEAISLEMKAA